MHRLSGNDWWMSGATCVSNPSIPSLRAVYWPLAQRICKQQTVCVVPILTLASSGVLQSVLSADLSQVDSG